CHPPDSRSRKSSLRLPSSSAISCASFVSKAISIWSRSSRRRSPPRLARFLSRGIEKNPPHRLGRRGEEMSAVVPALFFLPTHQPRIGLMHQRRGLQRLTRLLLHQLRCCQLAQLVVDQGKELFGGVRVALFHGGQDAGHYAHGRHPALGLGTGTIPV